MKVPPSSLGASHPRAQGKILGTSDPHGISLRQDGGGKRKAGRYRRGFSGILHNAAVPEKDETRTLEFTEQKHRGKPSLEPSVGAMGSLKGKGDALEGVEGENLLQRGN